MAHPKPVVDILLIEDDENDAYLTELSAERMFPDLSFQWMHNSEDATHYLLELPRTQLPQLILLDLKIPHMDGFEVLKRLRQNFSSAELKVVIFSSSNLRADIERASKLGASDYLVKAMRIQDFQQNLRDLIERMVVLSQSGNPAS